MTFKFQKKTPGLMEEKERITKEAKEASDNAIVAAQNCLKHPLFEKYREAYANLEDKCIQELNAIDAIETDPVKYGFQVKNVVSKIKLLGALLITVRLDAGKKQ